MKNLKVLRFLIMPFFVFIFASCSNLLEQKLNLENSSSSKNQNASLVINLKSQSRYIVAQDYDFSQINQWALSYSQEDVENPTTKVIAWTSQIQSSSSPSLSYSKENQTLIINDIPSGTYTIAVTGRQTDSVLDTSSTIEIFGSATGVKISNDSKATEIYLGLKKSKDGSGTFSLTLTDSENQFDNYYSSLQITLRNIFDDTKYYMKDPSGATTSTLKLEKSSDENNVYILSNADDTKITSGFYELSFYLDESKKVYIPADKSIIEIADSMQTSGETEIFLSRIKTYYSTNDILANGNGVSKSSPANLSKLLNKLAQNLPDEGEINIYADDIPEINIDSLENIKSKLQNSSKYISIYDKTSSQLLQNKTSGDGSQSSAIPSLMIANDVDQTDGSSDSTVSVDISGVLILSAGEKTQALVDRISVSQDSPYKITLKNGASLNISGNVEDSFEGTLQVSFVQEDESANLTDNFATYFTKPFVEFTSSSVSTQKFALYNLENQEVKNWNIEQKSISSETGNSLTYAYYLLPQNQSQLSSLAQNYSSAEIKANLLGDSQTTYSSASTIPYKTETLEFTLSISSGDSSQISNYAWFLEENLCENNSQSDLVKLTFNSISNLKNKESYNLSCYFVLDEKIYKSDFELKFEQIEKSAAVYLDGINSSSSTSPYYYNLKQVKDYKTSDSSLDFIEQYTSVAYQTATVENPIYAFDSNFSFVEVRTESDSSQKFSKYLMNSTTGLYDSGLTINVNEEFSDQTIKDISFDVSSDFLYVLTQDSSSQNFVYALKDGISYSSSEFTLGADESVTPNQIAVLEGKIYIAGDDCNIYIASSSLENENKLTLGDFELFASCANSQILSDYDESLHKSGEISITDLQLGDGLGNESGKLYVLVREESKTLGTNTDYLNTVTVDSTNYYAVFSRGSLIEIDTSTKDLRVHGWASYQDKSENEVRYFAPSSTDSSSVKFYGPSHFTAVVPKKLVILDDGFDIDGLSTKADTNGYSIVKNKDSFVEFDIESSVLTRTNEDISVTKPSIQSGFTVE